MRNDTESGIAVDLRNPIVRQDRIPIEHLNVRLLIGDENFEVLDGSAFGIAILSPRTFSEKFETDNAIVMMEKVITQQLSIKKLREEKTSNSQFKIAFEVRTTPLDITRIIAADCTLKAVGQFEQSLIQLNAIPSKFHHLTLELKEFFEQLKSTVDALESSWNYSSMQQERIAEEVAVSVLCQNILAKMDDKLTDFSDALSKSDAKSKTTCYEYFRSMLDPILNLAPFSNRSLKKPLGYAGDFEMMNMVYFNEPLGKSLFSKALHKYMVNMSGGKAVRNRSIYLKQKIFSAVEKNRNATQPVKFLSVASGPAMEVQLFLEEEAKKRDKGLLSGLCQIEFHFLDQDESSLNFAQKQIRTIIMKYDLQVKTVFTKLNIRQLVAASYSENDFQLIYSAGLFDYFSDAMAAHLANRLFESVAVGGKLIIGNFDISSPSKFFMELAWDWNLIYRSAKDLEKIFSPIGSHYEVESEPEKVNLFYGISK